MKPEYSIAQVDNGLLVKDATRLMQPLTRRSFLHGAASLGSLMLLTGCDVIDGESAENLLRHISRFNDKAQAALFDPERLAPRFKTQDITRPFPFNAFYDIDDAPEVDPEEWRLEIGGLVTDKMPWTLARLNTLPAQSQITKHICIEGWSAIGKWTGINLAHFLRIIGADLTARYVGFRCEDRYSTSLDMPTALHPQTQMALRFDERILPREYGFPLKIRVPTKLGFKNPKHVNELFVTNEYPGGFWEDRGYNWFSGL